MRSGSTELALDFTRFRKGSSEKSLSSVLSDSSSLLNTWRSGVILRFKACLASFLCGGSSEEVLLFFDFGAVEVGLFGVWLFFVADSPGDGAGDADGLGKDLETCLVGTETVIFLTTVFGFVVPNMSVVLVTKAGNCLGNAKAKM